MNTSNVIKTAGLTLDEQIKVIMAAQKAGDNKTLSQALKVGGIASMIVEKATTIAADPEKFAKAEEASDVAKVLPVIAAMRDERAKADGFLRFKAAHRAAGQVRKVDALLAKMSAPIETRKRSLKGLVKASSIKSVE